MTNITEVVNQYKLKKTEARKHPDVSLYEKLSKETEEQMGRITDAESEIAEYYKKSVQTGDWEDEEYWRLAAIVHPSDRYFEYFYKILEKDDSNYPHWSVLDNLAWVPDELYPAAAKVIEKAIDLNNPSWSKDVLNKAFEALTWIGDKEDIVFIQQKCQSEHKRIAEMAEYWMHNINDDWEDE